jgi:TolB-like protein/Tfp pilus assembly protein PilF
MLRLVIQLVDATTGAHLWAETYDRTVDADKIFAFQDELVPRIVSTVADWYGVLTHSMSEAVRLKPIDQVTPYEAVLRSFGYYERVTPEEHAAARSALERAVEESPGNADGWAMLSMMYGEEFRFGFNEQPDPMGRSLQAARRAVDVAPSNHFAYLALAQALFFRKEFDAFRHAAERAIALNPMDGSTMEYVAHLIAFSGDWDYGCEVAERARQLNPNHPGWYWAVPFYDAYRKGDYTSARSFALKIDQPTVDLCQVMLAAVYGQLGEHEAADRTVRTLLSLTPDTAVTRKQLDKWYQPELVEKLIDGLKKAGLNIDQHVAPELSRPGSTETKSGEGFWVAVQPFKSTGSAAELTALTDGLFEEIVTGLSRFSYLRVISRSYSGDSVSKALVARYVIEGSLRQSGTKLRLTVQLVDTTTGAHLWAETYDRSFSSEDIFALQDDLAPRIVSTVADQYGALVHSMTESLRGKSVDEYSPLEALLRAFGYWERVVPEEHAEVREILEAAVERVPDHSDCLAELSLIYWHEYAFGYNPRPDPIGRARATAQRAVTAAPTNHLAHSALATALFFQKDFPAFRAAADRAIALNRMDASTTAILGLMIAYAGDWEYGMTVTQRAIELNPHHPGWYHYLALTDAYRRHDYSAALASALKVNMPNYYWPHALLAAIYGQLGDQQRAQIAVQALLRISPNFAASAREEISKWHDPELTEHLVDGLRKAGLEIADEERLAVSSNAFQVSGEKKPDEGFWVAVLPFKFTGSNLEVATLAEGLSEEIITGLSRFSYLRVISRSSTLRYATETSDVRTVGKTLGARYVMEGSLRIAGSSLRVSVQLVDANTGAHLWAETYDRQFRAEDVFALQDDLVPRIVSTVADVNGVLPRSMSEVVCSKNPDELTPYEAVLRSFRYFDRVSGEELTAARSCLELAVEKAPSYADAWAMLALLFGQDYGQGFNLHADALNAGAIAAQRAVEAGPSNHLAHFSLAQARFFQKDFPGFRNAAERAVALNPMDANSVAFMGELLTYVGDWERGLTLAARAKEINPNHPGWFWYADFFNAYNQRDYQGALNLIVKANLPGHWGMHAGIASAAGQLGDHEVASKAVRDLLRLRPDFVSKVNHEYRKWFSTELREQLIDGLRKAGLEILEERETGKRGEGESSGS